jgi:hypothetical protein
MRKVIYVAMGLLFLEGGARFVQGVEMNAQSSVQTINNVGLVSVASPALATNTTIWMDDALPVGAIAGTDGGDAWNWVSTPSPYSGALANQSELVSGLHQHFFTSAAQPLTVDTGESLFAAVYLDPNNPPREIMLQWNDGSWEHRACWGDDYLRDIGHSIELEHGCPASVRALGPLAGAGKPSRARRSFGQWNGF